LPRCATSPFSERFARERPHAVLERHELAPQHGERRAQLVRHVGDEAPAQLLVALERLREAVEVLAEPAELVARADRDPRAVVAGGEPVRRRGDTLQRLQEHAREDHRQRRGEREREAGDDPRSVQLLLLEGEVGGAGEAAEGRGRDPADDAVVDDHRPHRGPRHHVGIADHRPALRVEEREARRDRLRLRGELAQTSVVAAHEAPVAAAAVLVGERGDERVHALRLDLVEVAEEARLEGQARRDRHRGGGERARRQDGEEQLQRDAGLHGNRRDGGGSRVRDQSPAPRRGALFTSSSHLDRARRP
jgi:hypothetical protein